MFGIRSKHALLQPTKVQVTTEGDLVVLTIGNSVMKMDYEHAITLSQWLRVRGKEAKRLAGDGSRHWHAIAVAGGAPDST